MCGIFGFTAKKEIENVPRFLVDGLHKLEYRGYDSAGIAFKDGEKINTLKAVGKLDALERKINGISPSGSLGFAHTRWATHGKVTEPNAHPHHDCHKDLVIVHNGIIENYLVLRESLKSKGHKFYSETDSEVFVHLVEDILKERIINTLGLKEAVREAFLMLEGLNAFIVAHRKLDVLVGIKNGSPMVAGVGDEQNFLASDVIPFLGFTRIIIPFKDNQGVVVKDNEILPFDVFSGDEVTVPFEKITWSEEQAEKGDFAHFFIKEVYDQPRVVQAISHIKYEELRPAVEMIKKAYGTYFSACGTASYACHAATYIFSDIARKHVNFAVGSEFYFLEDFLTPQSLLIAASQSGETADTLEAIRAAKKHKSKVIGLVNVIGSSMTRLVDLTIPLRAGPEKAVVSTKAFTAKLGIFLLLAFAVADKFDEGSKLLAKTAEEIKGLLDDGYREKLKTLADLICQKAHLYTIGRGINYPIALETALKIKEASYLHAEGFAGGELKHGVIALIEEGTPCLVLVANDEAKSSVLVNAAEMKLRGGYIIGISPEDNEVFDYWVPVPDVSHAQCITNTVPAQLLAYYIAVRRGLDPDMPRNLAKSVTVK